MILTVGGCFLDTLGGMATEWLLELVATNRILPVLLKAKTYPLSLPLGSGDCSFARYAVSGYSISSRLFLIYNRCLIL